MVERSDEARSAFSQVPFDGSSPNGDGRLPSVTMKDAS
jgi:hypothetical protein